MPINNKILIYGYGNPGRQDDGLGNEFVEMMKNWVRENGLDNYYFDSNYQLNIEEAHTLQDYDTVIFADASIEEEIEDFLLTRVTGKDELSFTSHAASPSYIYMLSEQLFGKAPKTYLLHIKGYEFEFLGEVTPQAKENLHKAFIFITENIINNSLEKVATVNDNSTLS